MCGNLRSGSRKLNCRIICRLRVSQSRFGVLASFDRSRICAFLTGGVLALARTRPAVALDCAGCGATFAAAACARNGRSWCRSAETEWFAIWSKLTSRLCRAVWIGVCYRDTAVRIKYLRLGEISVLIRWANACDHAVGRDGFGDRVRRSIGLSIGL